MKTEAGILIKFETKVQKVVKNFEGFGGTYLWKQKTEAGILMKFETKVQKIVKNYRGNFCKEWWAHTRTQGINACAHISCMLFLVFRVVDLKKQARIIKRELHRHIWKYKVIIDFLIDYIICDCIIIFDCIFDNMICDCKIIFDYIFDYIICDCIFYQFICDYMTWYRTFNSSPNII